MRNVFKFAKPKGPGFGISKGAYLSVLLGTAQPPPIAGVVAPKGAGGAVEGFGVPLTGGTDKARLLQPMGRGEYALATTDQKTVLKLRLLPVEEAGFDPEVIVRSGMGARMGAELLARIRGTWSLGQLTFESHDPDVYPALDFLLDVALRMAELTQGAIADPVARRYLLPADLAALRVHGPELHLNVQAHVAAHSVPAGDRSLSYTLGLQKFALPELEITGLLDGEEGDAELYLLSAAQGVLEGHPLVSGGTLPAGRRRFEAREGGLDRARWEGVPVLELLPPTGVSAGEALREWRASLR